MTNHCLSPIGSFVSRSHEWRWRSLSTTAVNAQQGATYEVVASFDSRVSRWESTVVTASGQRRHLLRHDIDGGRSTREPCFGWT